MIAGRSPRERRLLALGLLAAVLGLVWLAVVAPVLAGFDAREAERARLANLYALNERVVAGMRTSRAEARRQRATAATWAYVAATPEAAAEALRERVVAAARASGAQVTAAQPAQAPPGLVAVRADLTVAPARLDALLRAVQNARPPAVVETLTVTSERADVTGRAEPVDVRLEVAAAHAAARP